MEENLKFKIFDETEVYCCIHPAQTVRYYHKGKYTQKEAEREFIQVCIDKMKNSIEEFENLLKD